MKLSRNTTTHTVGDYRTKKLTCRTEIALLLLRGVRETVNNVALIHTVKSLNTLY